MEKTAENIITKYFNLIRGKISKLKFGQSFLSETEIFKIHACRGVFGLAFHSSRRLRSDAEKAPTQWVIKTRKM